MNQATKECSKCKQTKSIDDFHKDKHRPDGLTCACKQCYQKYYQDNIENIKQYRKENQSHATKIHQQYVDNHQLHIQQQRKEWTSKNRHWINQTTINRRKNNPDNQLLHCLRNRLNKAIKNNQKHGHAIEMLGCSLSEFRQYIEKRFTDGMTWNNYGFGVGKWNFDHIIPCSFFIMSDPTEQKICFHYSNYQPLWHTENIKKQDSLLISRHLNS